MTTVSAWAQQNNDYLAASLQWLRLRLAGLMSGSAPAPPAASTTSLAPIASVTPVASPAAAAPRRGWFSRTDTVTPVVLRPTIKPPPALGDRGVPLAAAAAAREAAAAGDPPPALCMLAARMSLTDFERDTLLLCAAVEIDPGIAALYAQIQGPGSHGAPTFALALQTFDEPSWDALSPHRPLRYARLVELAEGPPAAPLTTTPLRADERIVHYLKGLNAIDERLAALLLPGPDDGEAALAPSQQAVADDVQAQLRAAGAQSRVPLVQLVGPDAGSRFEVALAVCAALGRRACRLGLEALPHNRVELDALTRLWQRERLLLPLALYLDAEDLAGANVETAAAFAWFAARDIGPAFAGLRELPAQALAGALAFEVATPTASEQRDAWAKALAPTPIGEAAGQAAPLLAGQFDLNVGAIAQAVAAAGEAPTVARVWDAARRLAQPRLDQLAQRIDPRATWEDLVLPDEPLGLLHRIASQARHRFRVYEDWGYAARMTRGFGLSALFAGESGTGKTMAAEVLANELDLALYRIDLSAVVSKYIGETEKNLRRLFDAAETGGAILFFDEADALFGKRSEVKESHDRYANIEINYLLQRMEAFSGLAILATNMKSALDSAFMRRLRFVVSFPYPGPAERRRMWERALPGPVPREALDYEHLARLGLSGGNIHGIALNAAFAAAERGTPVTQAMLMDAVRVEMRKLDRPLNEAGPAMASLRRGAAKDAS